MCSLWRRSVLSRKERHRRNRVSREQVRQRPLCSRLRRRLTVCLRSGSGMPTSVSRPLSGYRPTGSPESTKRSALTGSNAAEGFPEPDVRAAWRKGAHSPSGRTYGRNGVIRLNNIALPDQAKKCGILEGMFSTNRLLNRPGGHRRTTSSIPFAGWAPQYLSRHWVWRPHWLAR